MKKFTLLSAVLVAGMATAQVVQVAPEQLKLQKVMPQSIEMNKEISLEAWNGYSKKVANADYDVADYYVVEGMMYGGLTEGWGAYPYGFFMVPAYQNVVFENLFGPTTWTINGETEAEDTVALEYGLMLDGMYYLPQTTDHMWQADDTTLLNVKGYIYGSTEQAQYLIVGANHMIASDGIVPLTQCEMYCDPMYREDGQDFYIVSAQSLGCPYAYGTDLVYKEKSLDTIISTVRNVSPLKINQINMPIYNATATSIEEILPEGAQVKVELIAADLEEGRIYSDSIYASTIIDPTDCQVFGGGPASLVAKFTEEDPFGGMMEVSVVCPGDFCVQITGYNEGNCDFGFMTDYYAPVGSTLFAVNGKYTSFWSAGSNLAISYDAYWPSALFAADSEALVAPVEGGVAADGEYSAFAIYTNVYDLDTWIVDEEATSEWLELSAMDNSALEAEGYVIAQLTATALPEGEKGRKGAFVIDVDGYKLSIPVVQGEVASDETAVENVGASSFNGKTFNLLGVEVDENYKGIVIKNGQKYIQ